MSTALILCMSFFPVYKISQLSGVAIGFVVSHDACLSLLCIILFVTYSLLYVSTNNKMLSTRGLLGTRVGKHVRLEI